MVPDLEVRPKHLNYIRAVIHHLHIVKTHAVILQVHTHHTFANICRDKNLSPGSRPLPADNHPSTHVLSALSLVFTRIIIIIPRPDRCSLLISSFPFPFPPFPFSLPCTPFPFPSPPFPSPHLSRPPLPPTLRLLSAPIRAPAGISECHVVFRSVSSSEPPLEARPTSSSLPGTGP